MNSKQYENISALGNQLNEVSLPPECIKWLINHYAKKFQQFIDFTVKLNKKAESDDKMVSFLLDMLRAGARSLRQDADELTRSKRVFCINNNQLDSLIGHFDRLAEYIVRLVDRKVNKRERTESPFLRRCFRIYDDK